MNLLLKASEEKADFFDVKREHLEPIDDLPF